jgi:hypothetical protein
LSWKRILWCIGGLILGLVVVDQAAAPHPGADVMHIALHDGFAGHTVAVKVDGREVYRRAGVTTDLRISRADAFDVETAAPLAEVEVTVEPGGLHAAIRLDVAATPYLAVDLKPGMLRFTPAHEPFRYM